MPKKKTYGFEVQGKTLEQLKQEYSEEAFMLGHKMMLSANTQVLIERAEQEMKEHVKKMKHLKETVDKMSYEAAQAAEATKAAQPTPVTAESFPAQPAQEAQPQ